MKDGYTDVQRSIFIKLAFSEGVAFAAWYDRNDYGTITDNCNMVVYFDSVEERDKGCDLYDELYPLRHDEVPDWAIKDDSFIFNVDASFDIPCDRKDA